MVRSALVQPDGSQHLAMQKRVLPERDVAIFDEMAKAVTMAAEPWLREALGREVLADTSNLRFLPLATEIDKRHPVRLWLVEIADSIHEKLLLRMTEAHAEYLIGVANEETNNALLSFVTSWTQFWFATVARLLGWQISAGVQGISDPAPSPKELVPWGKENTVAIINWGWTFADGGVVLLECWLPISFVRLITARLLDMAKDQDVRGQGGLRAGVVRTYRQAMAPRTSHIPVLPVEFPPLEEIETETEEGGLELVKDVLLNVAAELAKTEMKIGEILELKVGDIVELGKMAGEPMELSLNGHYIARGEVLVLDEQLGIRISEIISPAERLDRAHR